MNFLMNAPPWLLALFTALLFIVSDTLSAYWGKTGKVLPLVIVAILGPAGYLLFGLLNRKISLAVSGGLVNVMIVVGAVAIGTLCLGESMTLKQGAGLLLSFAAILLLA